MLKFTVYKIKQKIMSILINIYTYIVITMTDQYSINIELLNINKKDIKYKTKADLSKINSACWIISLYIILDFYKIKKNKKIMTLINYAIGEWVLYQHLDWAYSWMKHKEFLKLIQEIPWVSFCLYYNLHQKALLYFLKHGYMIIVSLKKKGWHLVLLKWIEVNSAWVISKFILHNTGINTEDNQNEIVYRSKNFINKINNHFFIAKSIK